VSGKYPVSKWKAARSFKDTHTFRPPAGWTYDHLRGVRGPLPGSGAHAREVWSQGPNNRVSAAASDEREGAAARSSATYVTKDDQAYQGGTASSTRRQWKAAPSTGSSWTP